MFFRVTAEDTGLSERNSEVRAYNRIGGATRAWRLLKSLLGEGHVRPSPKSIAVIYPAIGLATCLAIVRDTHRQERRITSAVLDDPDRRAAGPRLVRRSAIARRNGDGIRRRDHVTTPVLGSSRNRR